jgi:hypothetical protein
VRTTGVTYVFAFTGFYSAQMDSNHPTRALNRGTKMTTVTSALKPGAVYVFDFIIFLVPQRGFEPLTHALRMRCSTN